MTSISSLSHLLALPDELIVQIISNLHAIRSGEPQSQAFKNKSKERSRQRENHNNQHALYSLCLTNRQLNGICTPALYSSFLSSTTQRGFRLLQLHSRTMTARKELSQFVQYVENRLSDYLGNDLLHDVDHHAAYDMVPDYFRQLATLVRASPNIEQLCVVSIENIEVSFWKFLLNDRAQFEPKTPFKMPKLRTLALQMNTAISYAAAPDGPSFLSLLSTLSVQPMLSELSVSGVVSGTIANVGGCFKNLRRVEITESIVTLSDMDLFFRGCDRLEHIDFHWAFFPGYVNSACKDIFGGLWKQHETLQSLCLSLNRPQNTIDPSAALTLSNLRDFTALKVVTLCGSFLPVAQWPGSQVTYPLAPSLATRLPLSLERLTLLLEGDSFVFHQDFVVYHTYILGLLWDLTRNCRDRLPNLRDFVVQLNADGGVRVQDDISKLEDAYREIGVRFRLIEKLNEMA